VEKHFRHSSFREKLIEHLFIGEMLKHSWRNRGCALEIGRPEVDNGGYDVVAEENKIIRHMQLKAAHVGATAKSQKVHVRLASKPSGCVVWIFFSIETLELGPYLFFGGAPGAPLPDLAPYGVAKHTKPNSLGIKAKRPEIRVVPKGRFQKHARIPELYEVLFGVN
jgi:hypothetical protein